MTTDKRIYFFAGGAAEGRGDQRELLGGKGSGLAEMAGLGLPVPPGFTVTTDVCHYFHAHGGGYPEGFEAELDQHLERLEAAVGRRFGDARDPLLVSVRSGAPTSMPGMMDTILNLGLNDSAVAAMSGNGFDPRFVRDCYRRLLTMYGDVVMGVPHKAFEETLGAARSEQRAASDAELSPASLDRVIVEFERLIREHAGAPFPQDPRAQLWGALGAVFESWHNRRAREYRRLHGLSDQGGTAVNVQTMVFGNRGPDCATGVAFTRDPSTGERRLYGEYLVNAQGEDVVAGTRTPKPIAPREGAGLRDEFPEAERALAGVCEVLERHRRDMQDVEFTIEAGKLYMLQTRSGKRSGPAAVRIAVDMVEEGLIDRHEALRRAEPQHVGQMMAPVFDAVEKAKAIAEGRLLAHGLAAGPGAASGRIALDAERAAAMAKEGPVLLVRDETSPEDIVGMFAAAGILTSRGGMTSHAAVVARGLGKPCIVGAGALHVDEQAGLLRVGERVFREGDALSMDGSAGDVLAGALAPRPSEVVQALVEGRAEARTRAVECFVTLLAWADAERRLEVWANGDTPRDAEVARAFGAQGIGLCRTEHMFFEEDRIAWVRRMILAHDAAERREALARLLPAQQGDFDGILEAMAGLPVTIRLLDPPLHEFLPHEERALAQLAQQMGVPAQEVRRKAAALAEANPMLGHRGCRLGLTAPDIYDMQVEAIARSACGLRKRGVEAHPEIMMPLVGTEEEMRRLRERTEQVLERVFAEQGQRLDIPIGTMIEVPRAALVAGRIAPLADFFSFGTNDLTQMTYGYSRDDVGKFLPQYLEDGLLPRDPFASIDADGVGQLVELACRRGREARPDLQLGVCGEHGGDPASVVFFHGVGLDYVSCSPYRVPVARLAAARAALGYGPGGGDT
ncbi:MAG TPA: pyruvate, phosphate dikinase [Thermoanaerobaculia bacterium]|nr:pyruvate, phosphate dikinase [Thermoanaerobaculia bacterium]